MTRPGSRTPTSGTARLLQDQLQALLRRLNATRSRRPRHVHFGVDDPSLPPPLQHWQTAGPAPSRQYRACRSLSHHVSGRLLLRREAVSQLPGRGFSCVPITCRRCRATSNRPTACGALGEPGHPGPGERTGRRAERFRPCRQSTRRRRPESNRCRRLCRPLRSHSATSPRSRGVASGRVSSDRARRAIAIVRPVGVGDCLRDQALVRRPRRWRLPGRRGDRPLGE